MCLYRVLSPQGHIMKARQEAVEARRRLSAFGGEMREAWPLIRTALGRSLRHLGLVLRPALLASLPLISLLAWLSSAYGHAFPAPGEAVDVRAFPQPLPARLVYAPALEVPRIVVDDGNGRVVSEVPLPAPVTAVHKRQWWNSLIGNPASYLPDDSPVDWIEVGLPRKEYLPFGPSWLRGWETIFFAVLLLCSLAIRFAFRIE
jgi:hypothetical protein